MTGLQLQSSARGRWQGMPPAEVYGLSTDSRSLKEGDVFLALRGPHFDGHRFAGEAAKHGAVALIGDETGRLLWNDIELPQLEVSDTLYALGDIATEWRKRLKATVVAITGSYGKTTVRSMLEHGLNHLGLKVASTRENNNNLIGVPQTLLDIDIDARVALVECGVSEAGEMQRLAQMTRPDIAIITGLAAAHTEGLGGISGVAREKAVMLQHISPGGYAVLGCGVAADLRSHGVKPVTDFLDMDAEDGGVVHWQVRGSKVTLELADESVELKMELPASHWAADMALAATVICRLTGKGIAEVARALAGWQAMPGRMQRFTAYSGAIILNDTYNANPASMAAALDTLRRMPGRRFAILADMAELGGEAEALHAGLDISGLDGLILTGPQMRVLADTCSDAHWVPDVDAAVAAAREMQLAGGDVVLIKASRCMGLDRVVLALTKPHAGEADAV